MHDIAPNVKKKKVLPLPNLDLRTARPRSPCKILVQKTRCNLIQIEYTCTFGSTVKRSFSAIVQNQRGKFCMHIHVICENLLHDPRPPYIHDLGYPPRDM